MRQVSRPADESHRHREDNTAYMTSQSPPFKRKHITQKEIKQRERSFCDVSNGRTRPVGGA
nr:MAG TPA: hypothetical protein [Caudoviricetes sp.]